MAIFLATSSTGGLPAPLAQLYESLDDLCEEINGPYKLENCNGHMDWPDRGIYFFFSHDSDLEADPPSEWHLTRIGTVGVAAGSSNTLWNRLRQHRGNTRGDYAGGGNHRGSIFRRHVGRAFIQKDGLQDEYPYWGTTHASGISWETDRLRENEHPLEERVSRYIRSLPFLYVSIPGEPEPGNDRDRIESNSIAMVSHFRRANPRLYKNDWVGHESPKPEIHQTGLWNIDHVTDDFSPAVVAELNDYIDRTSPAR